MKKSKDYVVNLYSLTNKKHRLEFDIENSFFDDFEDSLISNGDFHVTVEIEKGERLIQVLFHIKGNTEMICDRSLEPFTFPIDKEDTILFKYADQFEEISENLIHIPEGLQELDLTQHIFELICIEAPMRNLHPKFQDEDLDEDDTMIYSSIDKENQEKKEEQNNGEPIDPRWKTLLNLKTNKK